MAIHYIYNLIFTLESYLVYRKCSKASKKLEPRIGAYTKLEKRLLLLESFKNIVLQIVVLKFALFEMYLDTFKYVVVSLINHNVFRMFIFVERTTINVE